MKDAVAATVDVPYVDVLWVARFDYLPNWTLDLHRHSFWQIIHILSGDARARIEYDSLRVSPGNTLILPPGTEHGLELSEAQTLETLDLKFNIGDSEASSFYGKLPPVLEYTPVPLRHQLERILREAENQRYGWRVYCRATLIQLLTDLIRFHREKTEPPSNLYAAHTHPLIRAFVEWVESYYRLPIRREMIADRLNYSYRQIAKVCKEQLGYSPFAFIRRYRIRKACELLLYSHRSIKEIAAHTGFQSVQHFSKAFAREKGVPPKQWQRNNREYVNCGISVNPQFQNVLRITKGQRPQHSTC